MKGRIVGDRFERLDGDDTNDTEPAPSVATARLCVQPSGDGVPAAKPADAKPTTKNLTVQGSCGPFTVHPADFHRRMPALEAVMRTVFDIDAAVWGVVHGSRVADRMLGAMVTNGDDGRRLVMINLLRSPCPVIRVALLAHEAEHIRNGDLENPSGHDPVREAECDAAAGEMCRLASQLLAKKGATVPVDAAACQACYAESGQPCRQGGQVWAEVTRLLDY